MNVWTTEHDEFCLKHRIPPSAKLLWHWLITEGKEGEESEPDLQEFNEWVAKKRGKGYGQTYLKNVFKSLIDHKVITEVKKFSWRIYRIVLKPLEWLKPPKKPREKNLQNSNSICKTHPSKPQSVVDEAYQQQQLLITENQTTLANEELHFSDSEEEVLNRPTLEIKLAIALFKIRGAFEKVENPEGFVRRCLRERWWEGRSNQKALNKYFPGNSSIWDELRGV